jgi:hypothetical protein
MKKSYKLEVLTSVKAIAVMTIIALGTLPFAVMLRFPYFAYAFIGLLALLFAVSCITFGFKVPYWYHFGFVKGNRLYRNSLYLTEHLLDAGIYKSTDLSRYVTVPALNFVRGKTDYDYYLCIFNSIDLQDRLLKIDVSSALDGFVQLDEPYLSKNRDMVIYHVADVSQDYRYTFTSLQQIISTINSRDLIPIDKWLDVPWCHMLIAGKTGSGKSYFIWYILICWFLEHDYHDLFICDPKQADLINLNVPNVYDGSNAPDMFDKLNDLLIKRQAEYRQLAKNQPNKTYKDFGLEPVLVVVDEFTSMQEMYNVDTDSKKTYKRMLSTLTKLVLMGRQLGIFVIIATQKPTAETLPTNIRSNLMFKVLLGNSDTTEQMVTFEQSIKAPELMGVGEGYGLLAQNGNTPRKLQVPMLKMELSNVLDQLTKGD